MLVEELRVTAASFMLLALGLGSANCSSTGSDTEGTTAGAGGSGATAGAGGSSSNATRKCGQVCQDYLLAHGVDATIWYLWNQNVAGHPSGKQDTTVQCPLGGSAHLTGTTGVSSDGIDTADMLFELQGCSYAGDVFSLTLTAAVSMQGSFESANDFAALTFSSPALETSGTLDYLDDPVLDETCEVTFAQQGIGELGSLVGRVCGREFNSQTALDPDASGGAAGHGGSSGASGGTTGGNGSCACFCPDDSDCTNASKPNPCGLDLNGIPERCAWPEDCTQ